MDNMVEVEDTGGGPERHIHEEDHRSPNVNNKRPSDESIENVRQRPREDLENIDEAGEVTPANNTANTTAENQGNQNVSENTVIIEIINDSKDSQLIHDRATLNYMLRNSPLGQKSSGIPRFLTTKHKIIIHIVNKEEVAALLNTETLNNDGVEWPIKC